MAALRSEISALQEELAAMDEQRRSACSRVAELEEQAEHLQEEQQAAEDAAADISEQHAQSQEQIAELETTLETVAEAHITKERESSEAIENLRRELAKQDETLAALEVDRSAQEVNASAATRDAAAARDQAEDAMRRMSSLEDELAALKAQSADADAAVSARDATIDELRVRVLAAEHASDAETASSLPALPLTGLPCIPMRVQDSDVVDESNDDIEVELRYLRRTLATDRESYRDLHNCYLDALQALEGHRHELFSRSLQIEEMNNTEVALRDELNSTRRDGSLTFEVDVESQALLSENEDDVVDLEDVSSVSRSRKAKARPRAVMMAPNVSQDPAIGLSPTNGALHKTPDVSPISSLNRNAKPRARPRVGVQAGAEPSAMAIQSLTYENPSDRAEEADDQLGHDAEMAALQDELAAMEEQHNVAYSRVAELEEQLAHMNNDAEQAKNTILTELGTTAGLLDTEYQLLLTELVREYLVIAGKLKITVVPEELWRRADATRVSRRVEQLLIDLIVLEETSTSRIKALETDVLESQEAVAARDRQCQEAITTLLTTTEGTFSPSCARTHDALHEAVDHIVNEWAIMKDQHSELEAAAEYLRALMESMRAEMGDLNHHNADLKDKLRDSRSGASSPRLQSARGTPSEPWVDDKNPLGTSPRSSMAGSRQQSPRMEATYEDPAELMATMAEVINNSDDSQLAKKIMTQALAHIRRFRSEAAVAALDYTELLARLSETEEEQRAMLALALEHYASAVPLRNTQHSLHSHSQLVDRASTVAPSVTDAAAEVAALQAEIDALDKEYELVTEDNITLNKRYQEAAAGNIILNEEATRAALHRQQGDNAQEIYLEALKALAVHAIALEVEVAELMDELENDDDEDEALESVISVSGTPQRHVNLDGPLLSPLSPFSKPRGSRGILPEAETRDGETQTGLSIATSGNIFYSLMDTKAREEDALLLELLNEEQADDGHARTSSEEEAMRDELKGTMSLQLMMKDVAMMVMQMDTDDKNLKSKMSGVDLLNATFMSRRSARRESVTPSDPGQYLAPMLSSRSANRRRPSRDGLNQTSNSQSNASPQPTPRQLPPSTPRGPAGRLTAASLRRHQSRLEVPTPNTDNSLQDLSNEVGRVLVPREGADTNTRPPLGRQSTPIDAPNNNAALTPIEEPGQEAVWAEDLSMSDRSRMEIYLNDAARERAQGVLDSMFQLLSQVMAKTAEFQRSNKELSRSLEEQFIECCQYQQQACQLGEDNNILANEKAALSKRLDEVIDVCNAQVDRIKELEEDTHEMRKSFRQSLRQSSTRTSMPSDSPRIEGSLRSSPRSARARQPVPKVQNMERARLIMQQHTSISTPITPSRDAGLEEGGLVTSRSHLSGGSSVRSNPRESVRKAMAYASHLAALTMSLDNNASDNEREGGAITSASANAGRRGSVASGIGRPPQSARGTRGAAEESAEAYKNKISQLQRELDAYQKLPQSAPTPTRSSQTGSSGRNSSAHNDNDFVVSEPEDVSPPRDVTATPPQKRSPPKGK